MSITALLDWIRKHRIFAAACAVALVVLIAAGIWHGAGQRGSAATGIEIYAAYDLLDGADVVDVRQKVQYRNETGSPLAELVFHLHPLAYETLETAPVAQEDYPAAYPGGFDGGRVQLDSVTVAGEAVEPRIEGSVLRIPLANALREGDSAEVGLVYTLTVPACTARYGAGGHSVNLLNAFAIPAIYGETGWRMDAYCAIGDPFVSEMADYRVEISVPEGYGIAATGVATSEKSKDGRVTTVFDAPGARDFAAVLSREYVSAETKVGDVRVISRAATQEGADLALAHAAEAVAVMSATFGPSVYDEIEICSADLLSGGMEYPGLAVISVDLYEAGMERELAYCVAHEVAHQWWYGAVGNDQINEPWMDESLAEYSTLLVYEQAYGTEGFQSAYRRFIRPRLLHKGLASIPVGQPITSFATNDEYASVVYAKGAAMWHALRQEMGDEAFFAALRTYYDGNTGAIATKQDLYDALGGDAAAFVEDWLTGRAP